jgi:protein gp37
MHPQWVVDIRDRCVAAGVSFLFKQWGEWRFPIIRPGPHHALTIDGRLFEPGARLGMDHMMQPVFMDRVGKHAAGRELDGRTWDEYPKEEA